MVLLRIHPRCLSHHVTVCSDGARKYRSVRRGSFNRPQNVKICVRSPCNPSQRTGDASSSGGKFLTIDDDSGTRQNAVDVLANMRIHTHDKRVSRCNLFHWSLRTFHIQNVEVARHRPTPVRNESTSEHYCEGSRDRYGTDNLLIKLPTWTRRYRPGLSEQTVKSKKRHS